MHALQPLLRSFQRVGLRHADSLSQCLPFSLPSIRKHGFQYRAQHNNQGPHKEYFQIPGQEPKPDLSQYIREPQRSSRTLPQHQPQTLSAAANHAHATQFQDSQVTPRGWLRVPRIIRSAVWLLLFLQLGVIAGTALITWEYLSPPHEPGSQEEQDLIDDILDVLDTHPMVQDLRENDWIEVDAYTPDLQHGVKGRNLVHQVLGGNNTQGIFLKVFHHPVQEFTMLVFFFGFGVEGWPDVIHGGMIATLLQEGLSKHIAYYYPGFLTTPDNTTKIDYKKPCKPGDVYGVLVAPSGRKAVTAGNVHLTELQMTSLLVQLEGAPVVTSEYDVRSNTEMHTVGIPARKGSQPTHAICQAEIKVIPKQLALNSKAFEVGGNDDGGFGRALEILKKRPEFKNVHPQPSTGKENEKD